MINQTFDAQRSVALLLRIIDRDVDSQNYGTVVA